MKVSLILLMVTTSRKVVPRAERRLTVLHLLNIRGVLIILGGYSLISRR